MKHNKTLLLLFALVALDFSCQSHKHTLISAYRNSNGKALTSWIKSWERQTQSQLSDNCNDTCKIIRSCYLEFFHPERPQAYLTTGVYNSYSQTKSNSPVQAYWIIQGSLPYSILSDIKLPDTTDLHKGDILDYYLLLTKQSNPDTLNKGEFLSKKNTPSNWLLLDSVHQKEITSFFENLTNEDSIAEVKHSFLKPYFNVNYIHDRATPLHKRKTWVAVSQPEIMLMAFNKSMTTAQIFFMNGDLEIGFAIMSIQQNNWKLIYTKLDYWDRSD